MAVLGLFVIVLASATLYTTYKSAAYADTTADFEEPKCTVLFDPPEQDVAVGDTFTVTVKVDDVQALWGYEIGLKFDRSVMEYVGSRLPYWRFISGRIEYLFWVAGTNPQNGEVELMEFMFEAKTEGSSALSLYVHELATRIYWDAPKDYVGWPIPHKLSEGLVTIS